MPNFEIKPTPLEVPVPPVVPQNADDAIVRAIQLNLQGEEIKQKRVNEFLGMIQNLTALKQKQDNIDFDNQIASEQVKISNRRLDILSKAAGLETEPPQADAEVVLKINSAKRMLINIKQLSDVLFSKDEKGNITGTNLVPFGQIVTKVRSGGTTPVFGTNAQSGYSALQDLILQSVRAREGSRATDQDVINETNLWTSSYLQSPTAFKIKLNKSLHEAQNIKRDLEQKSMRKPKGTIKEREEEESIRKGILHREFLGE